MIRIIRFYPILAVLVIISCGRTEIKDGGLVVYRTPDTFNVRVIAFDQEIQNPQFDRRCYYRLIFDKITEARTTTGLESQEKTYECRLTPNRHLLLVEKWVLDETDGRYVKLNNVEQPRPNYYYFDVPEKRIVVITLNCDKSGKAFFTTGFESIYN